MMKVLFVCLGNICRSPAAEGVFRQVCVAHGAEQKFVIDSAGTAAYHIGASPDQRMQAAAHQRGIDLSGLRGRQVSPADFHEFDVIVAMDQSNRDNLLAMRPPNGTAKLVMMLAYGQADMAEVPDPYYGGADGFEQVLDLLEEACLDFYQQHI